MSVVRIYEDLPPWARGVVIVGGLTIVYFTSKSVVASINAAKARKEANKTNIDAQNNLEQLAQQGVKPSYQSSQYKSWADQIAAQFDGCDWSVGMAGLILTESGRVLNEICKQLKNDADFLSLETAFGLRTFSNCGPFSGKFTGTLPGAVASELSSWEIGTINGTLKTNGIKFTL